MLSITARCGRVVSVQILDIYAIRARPYLSVNKYLTVSIECLQLIAMIISFKHKGLELFFTKGSLKSIPAQYAGRIERLLDRLDASKEPDDMNLPGYKFHQLKGRRKYEFAVSVTGNWRITFEFEGDDATNVNLEDYH